jgi:hypothetical protein
MKTSLISNGFWFKNHVSRITDRLAYRVLFALPTVGQGNT